MHLMPVGGQVERQIAEDLARRGVVGTEVSVDEDQSEHIALVYAPAF